MATQEVGRLKITYEADGILENTAILLAPLVIVCPKSGKTLMTFGPMTVEAGETVEVPIEDRG